MGHTNLTVEAHVVQDELLELGKDCHVRCNGPTQLVAPQIKLFEFCERRKLLDRLLKWGSCGQMIALVRLT